MYTRPQSGKQQWILCIAESIPPALRPSHGPWLASPVPSPCDSLAALPFLLDSPGAAQLDIRAVDIAGVIGQQKTNCRSGVLYASHITGRNPLGRRLKLSLGCAAGINETRGNGIDRDAVRCHQTSEGTREGQQAHLGDVVGRELWLGD